MTTATLRDNLITGLPARMLAPGRFTGAAIAAAFAIVAVGAAPAAGQSAYVPLDDVAYAYVDALIARGELRTLSALERPYTARDIMQALAIDGSRVVVHRGPRRAMAVRRSAVAPLRSADLRRLRAGLRRAVAKYDHPASDRTGFRAVASASLWATGETSGQRELMLADDLDPTVFAGGAARLLMAAGPVVGFSRTILENRLNSDPDFRGRTDRRVAGRVEDAYIAGQWRYAELFIGRVARNRGPWAMQGLLLSDAPFTYDHFFGRLGARRLNISTLLARLENHSEPDGNEVQRYLATHRLAGRWRGIEAAITESFVYTGVGRGFEPSLANPFAIYGLSWRNERMEGNLLVGGELAARTRLGLFSGELMIDDIQIDRCDEVCQEPSSFGLTLSAEGVPVPGGHRAFASYTRVSSLTYRTPASAERYSMFDVSLGRGFSDYDEWRVGADVVLLGAPLKAYLASRRQGSGDYRAAFPAPEEYATFPGFLEQPVARIRRVGLKGGFVTGAFDVRGDVGYNSVRAGDFVQFPTESGFEGRVRLSWNPGWARLRLAP